MEETERSQVDELIEFIFSYKVDMYRKLLELVDQQIKKDTLALEQEFQERASQLEAHHRRDDYREHLLDQYLDASFELEECTGIFFHAFLRRHLPCSSMSWYESVNGRARQSIRPFR